MRFYCTVYLNSRAWKKLPWSAKENLKAHEVSLPSWAKDRSYVKSNGMQSSHDQTWSVPTAPPHYTLIILNLKGARNAWDCCRDILQCPVRVLIFPCLVNIDIGLLVNTVSKCRAHMIEHEVVIRFHRTIHLLFYTQRVRETRGTVAETCYGVLLDDPHFHLTFWRSKKTVLCTQELITASNASTREHRSALWSCWAVASSTRPCAKFMFA